MSRNETPIASRPSVRGRPARLLRSPERRLENDEPRLGATHKHPPRAIVHAEPARPSPARASSLRRPLVWAFLSIWAVYAFLGAGWIGNPMGRSILDLTVSAVDDGTITIDPYAANSGDVAYKDGHFYSGMPPGASVIAVPLYVLSKPLLSMIPASWNARAAEMATGATDVAPTPRRAEILVLSMLFVLFVVAPSAAASVILLVLIWRRVYAGRIRSRTIGIAGGLFAFGTLHFYYGANVEHRAISTAMLLGAFLLLIRERDEPSGTRAPMIAAGALLAAAVTVTSESILIAALIMAYAASWLGRRAWPIALAAAPVALLLAAYNTAAFGSPLASGYAFRAIPGSAPPLFAEGPHMGLDLGTLAGYLFGARHGLFFYSPILVVALVPLLRRRVPRDVTFGWSVAAALLAFHYVSGYRGLPGEYGFRQMLTAMPFMAIGLPAGLEALSRHKAAVRALAVASFVVVAKGVLWGLEARGTAFGEPLGRWGVSSYLLRQVSDHLVHLGPAIGSIATIAGLALIAFLSRASWTRWVAPTVATVTQLQAERSPRAERSGDRTSRAAAVATALLR